MDTLGLKAKQVKQEKLGCEMHRGDEQTRTFIGGTVIETIHTINSYFTRLTLNTMLAQ